MVAACLNLGRFAEHDDLAGALTKRYRADGPPTLLNWTLMLLGYSMSFQGRHDEAERSFESAVSVPVPARTHTPNNAIAARVAFRRGDRRRAFLLLRGHLDELLETDNMQGASVACVEFINIMLQLGRLPDVVRMLAYLETTGLLDSPFFRGLVAEAAAAAGAVPGAQDPAGPSDLDDRDAVAEMCRVLGELIDGS